MAMVSSGWWLAMEVVDNGNDRSTKTYQLTSADATEAATDSAAVIAAFDGVSDAPVVSYHYYEKFVEDTLVLPAAGVELQNLALLDFSIVGHPEKKATHTVPAPSIAIFTATTGEGAEIVDTSDAQVIVYRDLFRTGGKCLISDGEVADSLIRGRRIHRASRKG